METCLDLEVLNELVDIMGDDMEMLINTYIDDSNTKLDQLIAMEPTIDQDKIFRLAHSLKGSSRNVGVIEFSNYCEEVETLAKHSNLTAAAFDIEKFGALFKESVEELKQRFVTT